VRKPIFASVAIFVALLPPAFTQTTGENPFNAPIRLELSADKPPCVSAAVAGTPSPVRSAEEHVQLGRIYAHANRADAALTEYAKAVDSDDARIRAAAVAETEELLNMRHRFVRWIGERLGLGANLILAALGLFLLSLVIWLATKLIRWIVQFFRFATHLLSRHSFDRRLDIQPLAYWPTPQAPYDHFQEIVRSMRDEMNDHFRIAKQVNSAQVETVLPTVFSNTILQELEVPMSIISKKSWPIFAWFIRQINPPDVVLEGSLSLDDGVYHVVVRSVRNSKIQKTWDCTIPKTRLSDGLKDLAYSILVWFTDKG